MIFETRIAISIANLYILGYIYMLEKNKCECSQDWRRDFIFYFSLFYIFSIISFMLFPEIFYQNLGLVIISKVILAGLLLVNIYCLYTYSEKLENNNCESANTSGVHFMKAFSFFYLVICLLVFSYLIHYYVKGEYIKLNKSRFQNRNIDLEKVIIVDKVN